jgi:iron complex outermembrane receptor protein
MNLRRRILVASTSAVAIAAFAAPALAAEPSNVSEVVVTGLRESLEKAIEIKRQSDNHVEAISSADIGKLPDKNVADALQRLPGVNTTSAASGEGGFDENDRVSIRGTSPSLTQVTVDGHSVSTGDWFILDQFQTVGRSVSFTLLPSEIVDTTLVYKTQDASLLEGGVAGVVDIVTRKPLSFGKELTFQAKAEAAYNNLTGKTKPQVDGLISWHNADHTFGILAQGFYEERTERRYGQETLGYSQITAGSTTGTVHPDLVNVWAPNLIGSTLFNQVRRREGGDVAIQWKPDDKVEFNLSGFYSDLNATNQNYNYMFWGSREIAQNAPTAYTVKDNTLVSATFPLNGPGISPASTGPQNGLVVDNIIRPDASGRSWYVNLDGKFQAAPDLVLTGQVGFTRGVGSTPTEPAFEVDGLTGISYSQSGNGWSVVPTDINPHSPAGLSNDWAWNETFTSIDREIYGKVDGDLTVDHGPFKDVLFGVHFADHKRDVYGWDRGCTLGADNNCWTSPTMPFSAVNPAPYPSGFNAGALGIPGLMVPMAGNPNSVISALNGIKDGVHGPISSIVQPQNFYWPGAFKVEEQDYSGYLMARIGGEGWRGNIGLRIVDTREHAYVNVSDPTGANPATIKTSAYGDYYIDKVDHNYLDFLPSVNLTFDLQKNLLLRVSAAETMARPDFSALGGTVSLTDTILTGNGGNPNLKPIKAAVFDGALEWYYAPSSVAAISVFYDDLSSYVNFGVSQGVYMNQLLTKNGGTPVFSTYNISSPVNSSGRAEGVELQVQQPIAMGFGVQANFTYVDSKDALGGPLVGTSKITYNAVGYYENKWLSVRLAYTYRSHFFVGLDRSAAQNQDNYGTLDGSVEVNVTPNVALTFDALNITNNLLKYYAINRTQPRAVYNNGVQLFGGLRVKF